jgi:hypothetical protein
VSCHRSATTSTVEKGKRSPASYCEVAVRSLAEYVKLGLLHIQILEAVVLWWVIGIAIAVAACMAVAVLVVYRYKFRKQRTWWKGVPYEKLSLKERYEVRAANRDLLVKTYGAIVIIGTLAFTATTFWLQQQTLALQQETQASAVRGQISDRYSKAVEMLSSSSESMRLGGIHVLISLMDEEDYRQPIRSVLAGFVRDYKQPNPKPPKPTRACENIGYRPPSDVQTALTALVAKPKKGDYPLDLRGAYLAGAELQNAYLEEAQLDRADLTGAFLTFAHMRGARLRQSQLQYACIQDASMDSVALQDSHLGHANLVLTEMRGADLVCANLDHADLTQVVMSWDDPTGPHAALRDTSLRSSILQGTRMRYIVFENADFTGADVSTLDITGADLRRTTGLPSDQLPYNSKPKFPANVNQKLPAPDCPSVK